MNQKYPKRLQTTKADTIETNNPKITSTESIRNLRQRFKVECSNVASEPGVASSKRAVQTMNIDIGSE